MSKLKKLRLEHPERCIGCFNCVFACALELFELVSATRTAISIKPCGPEKPFLVIFCVGCEDPPCVRSCKSQALIKDADGKIKLIAQSECNKCESYDCVKACSSGALNLDIETNKPILCTQCGKCAEICPHEVITYKEGAE